MNIRERTEELERQTLSPYAMLSENTKGRVFKYTPCDIRTEFQRDRDRIIHSKSFRRLKHKTQVFLSPEGDHFRTRLTHTLEVSQIARTIARGLRLNEDLVEAASLAHDLGHTPFGHSGEEVLDDICKFGFKHYEQSLRVIDLLEDGKGMNLTFEVRDAVLNHTGDHVASTAEGKILKIADRVAYINHDIDDAIRSEVLSIDDIPKDISEVLGKTHSERISTMICDVIEDSKETADIKMSDCVNRATIALRSFLFENVYNNKKAKKDDDKARNIIMMLFNYFKSKPEALPTEYIKMLETEDIERVVCDYVSGMTDNYAISTFSGIYIPMGFTTLS